MCALGPGKWTGCAILNIFWPRGVSWGLVLYHISAHAAQWVTLRQGLQRTLALINFPAFDFKSKCYLGRRYHPNFKKPRPTKDILSTGHCPVGRGTVKASFLLSLSLSLSASRHAALPLFQWKEYRGTRKTNFQVTPSFMSMFSKPQADACLHTKHGKQERAVAHVLFSLCPALTFRCSAAQLTHSWGAVWTGSWLAVRGTFCSELVVSRTWQLNTDSHSNLQSLVPRFSEY